VSAVAAVADRPGVTNPPAPPSKSASLKVAYQLRAGVVLSRPPQITRDLPPFEKAYYLYQRRLNERLALPFTKYFYFRADTPAEIDWKRKVKQRLTAARDIGVYNAYGEFGWNDELKVGAAESEPEHQMEALLKDAQTSTASKSDAARADSEEARSIEMPPSRITEADEKNDQKSLNRALQRTLYLLVQNKEGGWVFPNDGLVRRENLHLVGCSPNSFC
jgi:large subunit ribosomal protein L46